MPKTNDILNQDHKLKTGKVLGEKDWADSQKEAINQLHSTEIAETYNDSTGTSVDIKKGAYANNTVSVKRTVETFIKDQSDNESYKDLGDYDDYKHEENLIGEIDTPEEREYALMTLFQGLSTGAITKEEFDHYINEI